MNNLVFYRAENSKGRNDAKGAFIPEAQALVNLLDKYNAIDKPIKLSSFKNKNQVAKNVMSTIKKYDNIYSVSLFCHGWRTGVELFPRGQAGAKEVAKVLVEKKVKFLNLFACLAAELDSKGCFAQWIAEECCSLNHPIQVYGHETAGHTSWNPNVRFYWFDGSVAQTEKLENISDFRKKLKEDQKYRLLLPFKFDEV